MCTWGGVELWDLKEHYESRFTCQLIIYSNSANCLFPKYALLSLGPKNSYTCGTDFSINIYSFNPQLMLKLDGVGLVDNKPSTIYLHHFVIKNKKKVSCDR